MRKNFGAKTWLYPMPVLIIGTYSEDGTPNAMNAAWGGIYDDNKIMICLANDHKTTGNIRNNKEFTVSFATAEYVSACDYVGLVSANEDKDKFKKSGFTSVTAEFVNAPIINELPMALECKLERFIEDGILVADIVNVNAEERILDEKGKIDLCKYYPIIYDSVNHGYHKIGEKVGNAFSDGLKIKQK